MSVILLFCLYRLCNTTVCIRIVADFGSRIFQFTTKVVADYNVHIYYYFGYYFYTLLAVVFFNIDSNNG